VHSAVDRSDYILMRLSSSPNRRRCVIRNLLVCQHEPDCRRFPPPTYTSDLIERICRRRDDFLCFRTKTEAVVSTRSVLALLSILASLCCCRYLLPLFQVMAILRAFVYRQTSKTSCRLSPPHIIIDIYLVPVLLYGLLSHW